jgi:hypothetical protein
VPPKHSDVMAERLCELLGDDMLRSRMGTAARGHAGTLGWERSADSLLDRYRELIPVPPATAVPAAGG